MSTPYNPPNVVILTLDESLTVGTTAVTAYGQLPRGQYHYIRIYNLHASNTIWLSRTGTAAANAAGSYPIGPGLFELWVSPGPIPVNALSIVSTGASTPVTIEIG